MEQNICIFEICSGGTELGEDEVASWLQSRGFLKEEGFIARAKEEDWRGWVLNHRCLLIRVFLSSEAEEVGKDSRVACSQHSI